MSTPVHFDAQIGAQFLRYARLVANRGYIHNTLGNMAIRAPHPDHEHGVAYTKHAEISLEEMGMENIVITEIETSRLLYGSLLRRRDDSLPLCITVFARRGHDGLCAGHAWRCGGVRRWRRRSRGHDQLGLVGGS